MNKRSTIVFCVLALAFMLVGSSYAGTVVTNGALHTWKYYYVDVPAGTTSLRIETYGGTGDCDLYVKVGARPTLSSSSWRSRNYGNTEVIQRTSPAAGRYHIGLYAYAAYSRLTLKITVTAYDWRKDMLNRVNYERSRRGLVSLALNTQLINAAQIHASDMASHNFFSHTGSDGSSPYTRIIRQGYFTGYSTRMCAENIAAGQTTVASVMTAWMNSAGHRANILNTSMRHFGCGKAYNSASTYKYYWCQTFGYRR